MNLLIFKKERFLFHLLFFDHKLINKPQTLSLITSHVITSITQKILEPIYLFNKEIENHFITLEIYSLTTTKTTCEKDCPYRKPDRIKSFLFYEQHHYTEIGVS